MFKTQWDHKLLSKQIILHLLCKELTTLIYLLVYILTNFNLDSYTKSWINLSSNIFVTIVQCQDVLSPS